MFDRLIQNAALALAKLENKTYSKKLIEFTQLLERARRAVIIMPRVKEQFLIAYETFEYVFSKCDTTFIVVQDLSEYLQGHQFIEISKEDISIFGLPKRKLISKINSIDYDIAIDSSLNFDFFNAWLCRKLNAKVKIGFKRDNSDLFYDLQLSIEKSTSPKLAYLILIDKLNTLLTKDFS